MPREDVVLTGSESRTTRIWLWVALLAASGTALGGVIGQLLRIDGGRTGSYLGILVIATRAES
jgi:hypothetical protein